MSRETIARALKRLREQTGLTADQVGERIGKSGKTVNAWENNRGQPDADILIQLCDIYNVSDILAEFRENKSGTAFALSPHEKELVTAYRNKPDFRNSVNKLLDIPNEEPTAPPEPESIEIVSDMQSEFEDVKNNSPQKSKSSK